MGDDVVVAEVEPVSSEHAGVSADTARYHLVQRQVLSGTPHGILLQFRFTLFYEVVCM